MSDINKIVGHVLEEEAGYAGVEMYNDKYPAMQDDGGNQDSIKVRKEGDPVLATGTDQSSFAKNEAPAGSKMGDPNVSYVSGKNPDYAHMDRLLQNFNGQTVLKFGGKK